MNRQFVSCTHCHGSGWVKVKSRGRRGRPRSTRGQRFETTATALPFSSGSNGFRSRPTEQRLDPIDQATLSPGEKRSSTLYHQWSTGDVWVSVELALISGVLVGLSTVGICIATSLPWKFVPVTWLSTTAIVWGFKVKDFFTDDKAVIHSQEQERRAEPAPIIQESPSVEIVINSDKGQKRPKLYAPCSNHAGLWQYADALVRGIAAPSYGGSKGNKGVLGAKAYGYTPAEFDGREDRWRPTAITGGILEKDPHKSKGYRVTEVGKRALAVVVKRRLGEWG